MAIFPSKQSEQPGVLLDILPIGKISLHHGPSEMSPKNGSSVAAVHFRLVPAYHVEPSVNQAQVLSSLSTDYRVLPMRSEVQA